MQGAALIGNIYAAVVVMSIRGTAVIAVLMCSGAVDVRNGTISVTMSVGDTRHHAGELGDKKEPNEPGNEFVPAPKQHNDNLLPTGNANLAGFSHAVNAMGWRAYADAEPGVDGGRQGGAGEPSTGPRAEVRGTQHQPQPRRTEPANIARERR